MSYKIKRKTLCNRLLVGSAMVVASFGVFSCSDKYDLDSDSAQPQNLNSVYGYLEGQGNYTTYLRLINDLGQAEVLRQTGSSTLFAADDEAFARFFADNPWKVTSYENLSFAQKNLLLSSSMINNPYSTSMLSTADGPIKGEVFRRSSSVTIYDSVLVVPNSDPEGIMPQTPVFDQLRASTTRTSTVLFDDPSQTNPMLHFNAQFLTANKILSDDIDFIYGKWKGYPSRGEDDVYVNNAKVVEPNIFCKNGFVHRVNEVVMPLDNMAESLRKTGNTQHFSKILERFASVAYDLDLTRAYNNSKGTNYDSVFIKRYYSDRSYGSTASGTTADRKFDMDKNGNTFDGSLLFDPGWNGLYPQMTPKGSNGMMEDMCVMLVPSDQALKDWWDGAGGLDIHSFYAPGITDTDEGLKKVPASVLDKLINAGMKSPFTTHIPSNFDNLLDDANMKLGMTTADIDSVMLASNGLIYVTNKVFAPTDYSSVLSPAAIDTIRFSIIMNAIENLDYKAYLNSMVSRYIFLLPTNDAMKSYVDPVSFYYNSPMVWQFDIDKTKALAQRLSVKAYNCTIDAEGTPTATGSARTLTGATQTQMKDRLEEILDNLIITQEYVPGKKYYKTKGNTFVRVEPSSTIAGYDVEATWQSQYNNLINVADDASSKYNKQNGMTLVVDKMPMGAQNSVAKTLRDHSTGQFSEFYWVLENSGALTKLNTKDSWIAGDQDCGNLLNIKNKGMIGAEDATSTTKVTYLLNNFHYTLYAPTNSAMAEAYAAGLPDATALADAEQYDQDHDLDGTAASKVDSLKEVLLDFVKYHIQDNAIFLDAGFNSGEYESGKTELIKSTTIDETTGELKPWDGTYSPGRPYKLGVTVSSGSLSIRDAMGRTANVVTTSGMYNMMAREYWMDGSRVSTQPTSSTLNNSSFVAIHAIDHPLFFDTADPEENQFKYKYKPLYKDSSAAKRRK